MSDEADPPVPLAKLAKAYRKIKGALTALDKEFEEKKAVYDSQLDAIRIGIKDQMLALGVESVKTEEGVIILGTKIRYHTNDWDAFKDFVKDQDALDLFEKRIAQGNMATFLQENPTLVPPGLNTSSEHTITVRAPK